MSKKTIAFVVVIIIALIGGGYWLYLKNGRPFASPAGNNVSNNNPTATGNIFSPLAGNNISNNSYVTNGANSSSNSAAPTGTSTGNPQNGNTAVISPVPTLRELSSTPVGGMAASTTGTTTIVRWIDRGTGYVYQASSNSLTITELSNTTVPMTYQSFWNRNINAFIFRSVNDTSDTLADFYAVLSPTAVISASSTLSTNTPYQLHGAPLPSDTAEIAVNPENTEVFTLAIDGTGADTAGTGYISQFDGSKKSQIFTTPLTQLNVEWPADNIIALTTKGYSTAPGFLYFVNPKTGAFSTVLSNVKGLDTLTSRDGSQVLYSASTGNSLSLSVYDVKAGTSQTLAFNTLPEKCVWSMLNKDDIVCAVPESIPPASYPEAWYQGTVSFTDSLWVINVSTGEVHEIADLLSLAKKSIDAEDLTLDPKENFLYFINKDDLTLWSVSLNG